MNIYHRCQWHRRRCRRHRRLILAMAFQWSPVLLKPAINLWPVTGTPAITLLPVTMTPVIRVCHTTLTPCLGSMGCEYGMGRSSILFPFLYHSVYSVHVWCTRCTTVQCSMGDCNHQSSAFQLLVSFTQSVVLPFWSSFLFYFVQVCLFFNIFQIVFILGPF